MGRATGRVWAMSDRFVVTPGGRRDAEFVHEVAPGAIVHVAEGRMRQVTETGELLRDVGPVPPREKGVPLMPANVVRPPGQSPDFETGWIAFANFQSPTPLNSFVTTWVVPDPPQTRNGQLIYLFNGLQSNSMILQPVLQWGSNGFFGGDHWCVASWYADGQDGAASYSSPVKVDVGDTLVGRMKRVFDVGGVLGVGEGVVWTCEFVGIADSMLRVFVIDELLDCVETLECYSISRASDYPRSTRTRMRAIAITDVDGAAPALGWSPIDSVTDCGQHTVIVNVSEVQLWYRDDILPGAALAQGRWTTITLGHELIPMADGHVLDWVPGDGTWRLWRYDAAASVHDVLPGAPIASGQWHTIRSGHQLIPMPDGRVLDWVPIDGTWRLWNYDAASVHDVLPGAPIASGRWHTVVFGHELIPMADGHVLDWMMVDGTWRLWNYDAASVHDVLPGAPIASGQWLTIVFGHDLILMPDGRVLDWVPADGTWRLWNYDAASVQDVLPGAPVGIGNWSSIQAPQQLIVMHDGKVLDWKSTTGDWRLWRYHE
jgi:hypothetical protein